jgi:hypothetical protein
MTKVMQVSDALEKNLLAPDWNSNFNPKPIPTCCFFVEIVD